MSNDAVRHAIDAREAARLAHPHAAHAPQQPISTPTVNPALARSYGDHAFTDVSSASMQNPYRRDMSFADASLALTATC